MLSITREKKTRDLTSVMCIKGDDRKVSINGDYIKRKWKEYFKVLLNKKFPEENQDEEEWNL